MIKLSILIPTMPGREESLMALIQELNRQRSSYPGQVEILVDPTPPPVTLGYKRNALISKAKGEYVQFHDDDDMPTDEYIRLSMEGISAGVDVVQIIGNYFEDGVYRKPFDHYLTCNEWHETADRYHRFPNHLNCIKRDLAIQIPYKDINFGEDHAWAIDIKEAGLLKTEYPVTIAAYNYYFKNGK